MTGESGTALRKRRNRESLKKLVIEAGLELLDRDGLRLETASISYTKVFEYLKSEYGVLVTRASVHERIWPNHEAFRRDVLAEFASHVPAFDAAGMSSLRNWFEELRLDGDLDAGKMLDLFAQKLAAAALTETRKSPHFEQLLVVRSIAIGFADTTETDALRDRLDERIERNTAAGRHRLPALAAQLGLMLRTDLGLAADDAAALFQTTCRLLLVGGHLSYRVGSIDIADPVGTEGSQTNGEPWLGLSIGVRALLDYFYEESSEPNSSKPFTASPPVAFEPSPVVPPEHDSDGRRSRAELKRLVLAAAVELLFDQPIESKPESLGYGTVLAHIKEQQGLTVHTSSIQKRIWDSVQDYWMEVLTEAANISTDTYSVQVEALLDIADAADLTPVDRHQLALDILRHIAEAHLEIGNKSIDYRRRLLTKATLLRPSHSVQAGPLREALIASENRRITHARSLLASVIDVLGFEVKPELQLNTAEAIAVAIDLAMTTAIGAVFEHLAGIRSATRSYDLPRVDDPARVDPWPPSGFASRSVFEYLFQLRNDGTD